MKSIILAFALFAFASAGSASAATEQWRFAVTGTVYQLMADTSGGCAFVLVDTNSTARVFWLNKNGVPVYVSIPMSFGGMLSLNSCSPKQILFTTISGYPMMVQVDSKGRETPVAAVGSFVLGVPFMVPVALNAPMDKKGFFVQNIETNTMRRGAIVRYKF